MAAVTAHQVRAALNEIVDPCSRAAGVPAGLDEMGLVREVDVRAGEGGRAAVRVVLGLTEPACLMGIPFAASARERLSRLPGVSAVDVELAPGLDWSEADLAPAYRERLRAKRAERRAGAPPRAG